MIKMIDVQKLHPHPNNPRKDLGDLSELADSIKVNGILQNLTVVPWFSSIVGCDDPKQVEEMGYRVVIGHRRLAAAKLAGLKEVPCVITDMDTKTQLGTMLLENIQRNDLTIYEQAQGFQMMICLGETVGDISKTTGFSESTVRRRVKLLELNKDRFRASEARGASIMDYADLDKINDINLKNEVLLSMGTPNFRYELNRAIKSEADERIMNSIIQDLEKFATKVEKHDGFDYVTTYYPSNNPIVQRPKDADHVPYYYCKTPYGITIHKKIDENSKENKDKEELRLKMIKKDEVKAALKEVSTSAYKLRREFISSTTNVYAKRHIDSIMKFATIALLEPYCAADYDDFFKLLNVDFEESTHDEIVNFIATEPYKHLLFTLYLTLDSYEKSYYDWNNNYRKNENLDFCYDLLSSLGYQMSDVELELRNGTHALFNEMQEGEQ